MELPMTRAIMPRAGKGTALRAPTQQTAPRDEGALERERESVAVLAAKYHAYVAAEDAIKAIYNQPRTPDAAHDELEFDMERLAILATDVATRLEEGDIPADSRAAEIRAEILILEALRCGRPLPEIASIKEAKHPSS
jgi:hypothetical protein